VYFVEGHNFHVEWHCWFEVQNGEKCRSTPLRTIHWRPENSDLGMTFAHHWLRKRSYTLCKSCKGLLDLQLSYLCLGPLQLENLEKNRAQHCYVESFHLQNALVRDVAPGRVGTPPYWPYVNAEAGPRPGVHVVRRAFLCVM
jgi:hypothetical protein